MTLADLLAYLDAHTPYAILDGEAAQTLDKARAGAHRDALVGRLIKAIADGCGCTAPDCTLERAAVVQAVAPIRLEHMRDDAPVEGFRLVEGFIQGVDAAFDEEALRLKGK